MSVNNLNNQDYNVFRFSRNDKIIGSALLITAIALIFIVVVGIMGFQKSYPFGVTFGHVSETITYVLGIALFGCLFCNACPKTDMRDNND